MAIRSLALLLAALLLIPSNAQAANAPSWMAVTPSTGAHYVVELRNTPNQPVLAAANWTVRNVTSYSVTMLEAGLLSEIGALGVSLISNAQISLLSLRIFLPVTYNLTSRACLKPCPQLNVNNENAWAWIPSVKNSSLAGQNFNILQTTFEVLGNETLAPFNRIAWRLLPLVQVYLPSLLLYNFWYDQATGILLRADLFSAGDGNLTVLLTNTIGNLQVQGIAAPLTPIQISLALISVLTSVAILAQRAGFKRKDASALPSLSP